MNQKQLAIFAAVSAAVMMVGAGTWKVVISPIDGGSSGGIVAILLSSFALYTAQFFSTQKRRRR